MLKKLTEIIFLLGANVVDDHSYLNFITIKHVDEFMSVLCFEKDNLVSLTNVCKTYILNTKQIQTNFISRKVRDDRF